MTDPDEMRRALAELAAVLDEMLVVWAVGGSLASAAYGEPRATNDIDLIATLSESQARDLVARLGPSYYADGDAAADAARRKSCFNVIDKRSFIKLDVFIPPAGRLGAGQLDRRVKLDIFSGMGAVPVLGPEDVVLQKLRWFQIGGEVSDRQWRDIISVLRGVGREMDAAYMEDVCQKENLGELLLRAQKDAG
jgi:hypothetical protein